MAGLAERGDRTVAHDLGRHTRDGVAHDPRQRLQVVLLDGVLRREDHGAGSVADARRVAGLCVLRWVDPRV